MPAIHLIDSALSIDQLGALIFAGDILVFTQVPPLLEACNVADGVIREMLMDDDPPTAEQRLAAADFIPRARRLRQALFGSKGPLTSRMKDVLEWTGLHPEDTYWDKLEARVVPSQISHHEGRIVPLPPHRDSWGSNLPQQINWWTPLYPTSGTRTIAFYPEYWNRPIANESANWDYLELKRYIAEGRGNDYPILPAISEPLPSEKAVAMSVRPGDLLCFSSAHLHSSLFDQSNVTRFSLETRTISMAHYKKDIGAPNVDGNAPRVVREWFNRMSDGVSLADT